MNISVPEHEEFIRRLDAVRAAYNNHAGTATLATEARLLSQCCEEIDQRTMSRRVAKLDQPAPDDSPVAVGASQISELQRLTQAQQRSFVGVHKQLAELATKLDRHGKSLGKAFRRIGEMSRLVRGLTGVTMGADFHLQSQVDKLAARMDDIGSGHCDMHSQIRIAAQAFNSHSHATDERAGGSSPPLAPAPPPTPCEHPNPSWAATLISSHSVQVLTCDVPRCKAKKLGDKWYIPQPQPQGKDELPPPTPEEEADSGA